MGCDIHSIAQIKRDGKWKTVLQDVAGDGRSYDTFAVLANVRNGYGFAGVDTGDGFIPISQPKGLPDDLEINEEEGSEYAKIPAGTPTGSSYDWADEKYRKERMAELLEQTSVWLGDHSHSWLTLAEIKEYIQKVAHMKSIHRGFVSEAQYLELRKTSKAPESYSGGISGPDIVTMTAKQYLKLESSDELPSGRIYVQMQWETSYLDSGYIPEIVQQLEDLAKQYEVSDSDIRMVFGFDS